MTNDSIYLNINGSMNGSTSSGTFTFGPEAIFVPVLFTMIVVLGCVGNFLVILIVVKSRGYRRNTTNLFIFNLALADILFLTFCVPFHAFIYSTMNWPFGEFMCKVVHFLQYQSMATSVLLLVAMSTDRYLAVAYPLETRHLRTPKMALTVVVIIWVIGSGVALPWPIVYTVRTYSDPSWGTAIVCADAWGSPNSRSTYFLLLFLFLYIAPLIIIFIFSTLMVKELWLVPMIQSTNRNALQSKQKVVRMVVVVVSVFLICWMPFHLCTLWISYGGGTFTRTMDFYYIRIFAHCLSYANSCMNPCIYGFMSKNFRRGFKNALRCQLTNIGLDVPNQSITMTDTLRSTSSDRKKRNGRLLHNDGFISQNGTRFVPSTVDTDLDD